MDKLAKLKFREFKQPNLELVLANMPGYFYWKNIQSQYMWCNTHLAKISGLQHPSEIVGKTDYDFAWGEGLAEQFILDDQRVMFEEITLIKDYQLPIKREDGQRIWVRTDKVPLYGENGDIIGVLAVAVDITDQKVAEQKTHIAHTFIEDIIFNLPGLIYWKNKESQYVGFNKNVVQLSGLTREELLGKTDLELNWGQKEAQDFQNDDHEVMETGITKVTEHQIPIKRPDGNYMIVRTEKSRLHDRNGNVAGILGVAMDITEQKILESKLLDINMREAREVMYNLDTIIANMPGYIYWKNSKSEYMGCNKNLARVSGLKSRVDIVGMTDYDFAWGNGRAQQFIADDQFVMQTQERQVTEYELPIKRDDGVCLFVRTEKMPLYSSEAKVIGVLAVAIDITEQKVLEKNLRDEKAKTELLSQYKTEFIRNMEHDIRTPFSGVYSMTKLLRTREVDQDKQEMIDAISQCAKELLDYCNGILDFSRIESGVLPILVKKFDLRALVEGVISIEKPAAKVKDLQLLLEYASDLPSIFIGDEYRIQRILINLVSNAIKFTKQGYVKLSVKLGKQDGRDCIICFYIEDTGIGIPKEKQNYIYESFSRLTPANQGVYKGSGLGLSIVKHLVKELDGEIEVESTLNKGTLFLCTLLLKRPLLYNE